MCPLLRLRNLSAPILQINLAFLLGKHLILFFLDMMIDVLPSTVNLASYISSLASFELPMMHRFCLRATHARIICIGTCDEVIGTLHDSECMIGRIVKGNSALGGQLNG